jgi:4-amino-4-deoxy-L-arabinose transferase-like glycosyltransferase
MAVETVTTLPTAGIGELERGILTRASKIGLAAFGLSLLLIGLGIRTLTRHEVLAAYPAKEMLLHGHWIVPMFAGIPRTAKTPGMYWLIAGFMKLFHSDSEFVVRLPSALSGVATALMVASFAAKFYGRRIGMVSGLMMLTSAYVLVQARLAESDMLLTALVCAAMLIFASGPVAEIEHPPAPQRKFTEQLVAWRPITFYLLAALTFLLKGFVGPIFILAGAITYAVIQRDRRSAWFLLNPLGVLLFLDLVAAWPIAALVSYPPILESWRFEQFGRLTGERGSDPFYFYLYSIPASLLPWTPFMILPAWTALKIGQHRRPLNRFFICWFVPGVIVLSLSAFKHQHYAFPLLPPLAILGAVGLLQYIDYQRRKAASQPWPPLLILLLVALSITIISFYIKMIRPVLPAVVVMMGWLFFGGFAVLYAEYKRAATRELFYIFLTAWGMIIFAVIGIVPAFDDYKLDADLARSANDRVPNGEMIYIIDPEPQVEPHSAWYLRQPIRRFRDVNDFLSNVPARSGQTVYVITNTPQSNAMSQRGAVQTILRCKTNPVTSKTRDLILVSYAPNH